MVDGIIYAMLLCLVNNLLLVDYYTLLPLSASCSFTVTTFFPFFGVFLQQPNYIPVTFIINVAIENLLDNNTIIKIKKFFRSK